MIKMLFTTSETRGVEWCKWFCSKLTFSRNQILSRVRAQIMTYELKRRARSQCFWPSVKGEMFNGANEFAQRWLLVEVKFESRAENDPRIKAFSMITMLLTIIETGGNAGFNRFCWGLNFSQGEKFVSNNGWFRQEIFFFLFDFETFDYKLQFEAVTVCLQARTVSLWF